MTTADPHGPVPDAADSAPTEGLAGGGAAAPPVAGPEAGHGGLGTAPPPPSTARRRARATGIGLFLALLIFVTVVLVLFVVFNTQTVQISLVFGTVHAPLVLALVVAAALGGLVVGLATLLRAARRRSR